MDHPSCAGAMDQSPSTGADSSTTCRTMSVDDQQLRGLRSQVRLSEAFSGIRFTNTSWEITHNGTECRKYTVHYIVYSLVPSRYYAIHMHVDDANIVEC